MIALTPCRNLRSHRFLSVCTGCNMCRASATYVNPGCRRCVEVLAVSTYADYDHVLTGCVLRGPRLSHG